MKYHTLFTRNLGKMLHNLSFVAVVIGALRVKLSFEIGFVPLKAHIILATKYHQNRINKLKISTPGLATHYYASIIKTKTNNNNENISFLMCQHTRFWYLLLWLAAKARIPMLLTHVGLYGICEKYNYIRG